MGNTFEFVNNPIGNPKLPKRATKGSAGYDFYAPYGFSILPHETEIICSGIKAKIKPGEFLMVVPRSSLGIIHEIMLANTVGIIDEDYYNNEKNEGQICIALHNMGDEQVTFQEGDRLVQGIFVKYDVTDNDDAEGDRKGGIGSTGGSHA